MVKKYRSLGKDATLGNLFEKYCELVKGGEKTQGEADGQEQKRTKASQLTLEVPYAR